MASLNCNNEYSRTGAECCSTGWNLRGPFLCADQEIRKPQDRHTVWYLEWNKISLGQKSVSWKTCQLSRESNKVSKSSKRNLYLLIKSLRNNKGVLYLNKKKQKKKTIVSKPINIVFYLLKTNLDKSSKDDQDFWSKKSFINENLGPQECFARFLEANK